MTTSAKRKPNRPMTAHPEFTEIYKRLGRIEYDCAGISQMLARLADEYGNRQSKPKSPRKVKP
jgi:hypothetical protein